jgi:hypothetical protein
MSHPAPHQTLHEMRLEFEREGGRTLAFPIAGTIAWIATGIFGIYLSDGNASIALFICNGLIFPMSLLIAKALKENVMGSTNDLDRLFGRSILMVNLIWVIAIPFWMVMPASLPLTVGVFSGLHWIIFGWIVQHWIGMFHTVVRAGLVVVCWFLFPDLRFVVIPFMIVAMYLVTIYVLATRPLMK